MPKSVNHNTKYTTKSIKWEQHFGCCSVSYQCKCVLSLSLSSLTSCGYVLPLSCSYSPENLCPCVVHSSYWNTILPIFCCWSVCICLVGETMVWSKFNGATAATATMYVQHCWITNQLTSSKHKVADENWQCMYGLQHYYTACSISMFWLESSSQWNFKAQSFACKVWCKKLNRWGKKVLKNMHPI